VPDTSDSCETNHSRKKTRGIRLLIRRLAARVGAPGDETSVRGSCIAWRLAARCAPPGGDEKTVRSGGRWRLAVGECRQAVWSSFRLAACGLGQAETLLFCVLWCAVFN